MTGDYAAIEIFSYKDFKQVGEFFGRLGMMYKLSDLVREVCIEIYKRSNGRIIICIENNFEKSIIENLLLNESFHFEPYIYKEPDKDVYGVNTNIRTRDLIISEAYSLISEDPKCITSKELISEISSLEQRANGRIEASRGFHDDCFMAMAICAYVRRKTNMIYMPMINIGTEEVQKQDIDFITQVVKENLLFDDNIIRKRNIEDEDYFQFSSEEELDDSNYYDSDYNPFVMM